MLTINVKLVGQQDVRVVFAERKLDSQAHFRIPTVSRLNDGPLKTFTSIATEDGAFKLNFTEPGFDRQSGALNGGIVFAQTINGDGFIASADELNAASSLRVLTEIKRGSSADFAHLTISPQDPSFKAFATSCNELQPGRERNPSLVLHEDTEAAAKLLPQLEASQLRTIVSSFEDAVTAHNVLATNEGSTKVARLMAFGPEKRCQGNDKQACEADEALSEVQSAMVRLETSVTKARANEKRAAGMLAEVKTPLTFVFSDQIQIGAAARGEVVALTLQAPLYKGQDVAIAQGTVAHFLASTFSSNQAILNSKDLTLNGTTIPLRTTQCTVKLMDEPSSSPFNRQPRDPSQPPFHAQPRAQATPQRTIAAGSTCAVTVVQPIIHP